MAKLASKVVAQAQAWLGLKESDGSFKKIIDIYNSHPPLARGYKLKYTDAWCAGFVSAVAITLGYTDIIPTEVSCTKMIELFKKLGCWVEDESATPKPGWIPFYDWDDNGKGDNTGSPDHVGIVEKVVNGEITVIEGNYSNAVKRRTLSVNGRYIRGYGVPKYDAETASGASDVAPAKPVAYSAECFIRDVQRIVGMDQTGKADDKLRAALPVISESKNSEHSLVKLLQIRLFALGFKFPECGADGDFGAETGDAVRAFQRSRGLMDDRIAGKNTWNALMKD